MASLVEPADLDLVEIPAPFHRARLSAKQIFAICAGTALEVYDYLTYAYFAVFIGQAFFPSDNPTNTLLASLGAFAAGFITRPLGAFVIGRMGDKMGRKPAMLFSFMMLGVSTFALAVTPSHAVIGTAAPVLAVFFRMLQGFALGGEMGPTTTYLVEAAPIQKRGQYVAFQYVAMGVAGFSAGLIGVILANVYDDAGLRDYGWRIAMLVGVSIIPLGLILRRTLVETLPEQPHDQAPVQKPDRSHLRTALVGLIMMSAGATVAYVLGYFATYSIHTLGMPANVAFGATTLNGLCGIVGSFAGGILADRFGRRPIMIIPWVIMLVSIYPMFWMIATYKSVAALYATQAVVGISGSIGAVTILVFVTEALPARIRSSMLSLVFALATAVFAGMAQFNVAWLTDTPTTQWRQLGTCWHGFFWG